MKSFMKYTLASMVGLFLAGILFMFFSMFMIGAMISSVSAGNKKVVTVKDNSVLHLKLNEQIVDRAPKDPFEEFNIEGFDSAKKLALADVVETIEAAADDEQIKGIYLDISGLKMGFSAMTEVRAAIEKFKESEKFVYAYSEDMSQGAYYMASSASELYLYPEGGLRFQGLNAEVMFMKGMLDKLDIEVQVVRGPNNDFKSAVEPFFLDRMSDSSRVQTAALLEDFWGEMTTSIAASRNLSVDKLNSIADSLAIRKSEDAVEYGLADGLKYQDEVYADLREKLELEEDDKINFITLGKYMDAPKSNSSDDEAEEEKKKPWEIKNKIAVIYANGGIISGEGDDETIGSDRIAKAIRTARKDTAVKAVVLRVNSPGGSALASDVIWRETMLTKKEKPFVVSMGDVAASGGYYIACGADRIFAHPTTITGSIGVFGMLPTTEGFFNNKLGITFDRVGTNEHSAFMNSAAKMSDMESGVVQDFVDDIYYDFIGKVAEGRNMTQEQVDVLARGRVWSGTDALDRGLVDEFGSLEDAIDYAAEAAELGDDYKVRELPKLKDPFEEFFKSMSAEVQTSIMEYTMGDDYKYFKRMKEATQYTGIQARLPYYIDIY